MKRWQKIVSIICLYALLLVPIFYALCTATDLEFSWLKKIAYLAVVGIGLLLPALVLKGRTYFIVEGILNVFFVPIDIVSLYLNHQSASKLFLNSVFSTNWDEAVELVTSLWPLCIVVVIYWVVYFVLSCRITNDYLYPKIVRKITLVSSIVLLLCAFAGMTWLNHRLHSEKGIKECMSDATGLIFMKFYKIYPYNIYLGCWDLYQDHRQWKQTQEALSEFQFGIAERAYTSPELYILVIGESSRYDHWGINGYHRNTTPMLSECSNIVSYDSAYAQANLTNYSMPLILTRATAAHSSVAYQEKSLPEAFAEAGFYTAFISKNTFSPFTERIMKSCDYGHIYPKGIDVVNNYDGEMVNDVRDIIQAKPQMMVLHTLGSHYKYSLRYPESFSIYKPVFEASYNYSMISAKNKDLLMNAYDNSICYTDYVMGSLIHLIDSLQRPAVVMYVSDHGESFWDDERGLSLHGSYEVNSAEYHVPFVIWYSDEYASLHPDKVHCLQANRSVPITSQTVFYSLADMAGLSEVVIPQYSICSDSLHAQREVYVLDGTGQVVEVNLPTL